MATKTDNVTITGNGTTASPVALKLPLVLNASRIQITSHEPGQAALFAESTQNYGVFCQASSSGSSAIWANAQPGANAAVLASHNGNGRGVDAQSEGTAGFFWSRGANVPAIVGTSDNGEGGWLFGDTLGLRVGCDSPTGSLILGIVRGEGTEVFKVAGDGTVFSKGTALISDRNAKANLADVDQLDILKKVSRLSIKTWNYKDDSVTKRHLGPAAEDFYEAFGLNGEDNTHIFVGDSQGVALAAIQALYELNQQKEARITQLENRLAEISELVDTMMRKP